MGSCLYVCKITNTVEGETLTADPDWRDLRSKARDAEKKRDFAKAEAVYRLALETIEKTIGADSVPAAQILLALGDCFELEGRAKDAQALYQRARAILDGLA